MTKNWKKFTAEKKIQFFKIKNYNLPNARPPLRTSKLQKKPSALKREHPILQNMKFQNFFYFCGSFLPSLIPIRIPNTDPKRDSEYGSGSTDLIASGSNRDLVAYLLFLSRLDSSPQCSRSDRARYQLSHSHPSLKYDRKFGQMFYICLLFSWKVSADHDLFYQRLVQNLYLIINVEQKCYIGFPSVVNPEWFFPDPFS
jgi:hypothetical protein